MKINIEIELSDSEIEYLNWFKTQVKPEMIGYQPTLWGLEYMGVLITTNIDHDGGGYSHKTYIFPSKIGKQILEML